MRNLNKSERKLVNSIIGHYHDGQSITLGSLLLEIYPIEYIKPSDKNDDFYKKTITISYNRAQITDSILLEAINLFDLLISERYILIKNLFNKEIIGEENRMAYISDKEHHFCEIHLPNFYDYDLWSMLNSYYYVSNSLFDFARDYKTVEQRHHEDEMNVALKSARWSKIAAIIAFVTLCFSMGSDIYQLCNPQYVNSNQINAIQNSIKGNHIVEPLNVQIDDTILCKHIVKEKNENHILTSKNK